LRDYMNRPRPSWDEVKAIAAEKDKNALSRWEDAMAQKVRGVA